MKRFLLLVSLCIGTSVHADNVTITGGVEALANNSLAVSPANRARIRYNSSTNQLEQSLNGAAYTALGGSVTTDATLTGTGTVANPLRIALGHANSWTATQTFQNITLGADNTYAFGDSTHRATTLYSLAINSGGNDLTLTPNVATNFAPGTVLDLQDASTAAVSATAHGRLRYNNTTRTFEASYNGGSWGAMGSVTSVGLSMPSIFSVSGSPVTSSGTLTAALATQSANLVWAGPSSGGAAAPTFRALVSADLPGGSIVNSVSNSDSTLTISPTTGAVVASLNLAQANTWTAVQTIQITAIGTAQTAGATLQNTTAAALNAQQYSPLLELLGQGWKTNATAASQTVKVGIQLQPVQGAANPTSSIAWMESINGAAYTTGLLFQNVGTSNPIVGNSTNYIQFTSTSDIYFILGLAPQFYFHNGQGLNPQNDNAVGLGTSSARWSNVYSIVSNAQHFSGIGTAPTIAIGNATQLGTSPSATMVSGSTDAAGSLNVVTGTGPAAFVGGTEVKAATVTFNTAYGAAPHGVVLTPANNNAGSAQSGTLGIFCYVKQGTIATTTFDVYCIDSGAGAFGASTTYSYSYVIIQ